MGRKSLTSPELDDEDDLPYFDDVDLDGAVPTGPVSARPIIGPSLPRASPPRVRRGPSWTPLRNSYSARPSRRSGAPHSLRQTGTRSRCGSGRLAHRLRQTRTRSRGGSRAAHRLRQTGTRSRCGSGAAHRLRAVGPPLSELAYWNDRWRGRARPSHGSRPADPMA